MGFVGICEAEAGAPEAARATGRIGAMPRAAQYTATFIEPPEGRGRPWLFGPEIGIERREATREFGRRGAGGLRIRSVLRTEFRLAAEARHLGLALGATLLIGEMPLGQRRVHAARLQAYSARLDPVIFEDLAELEPPFDTPAARERASDGEAATALGQNLRRNPYISDRTLSASLAGGDARPFVSYEDGGRQAPNEQKDSVFAIGIVADLEAARAGVYAHPRLRRLFDASGAGRARIRVGRETRDLALPPEVADKAPIHLDLAVAQALCGAGRRVASWEGRPVGDYALYLFEQHLLAALRRREADLLPTLGWRDGFEPMSEDGLEWRPGVDGEEDPDDDLGLPRAAW